jgi:Polyribonucleotide nucleotidyltransferase (polynucleotide phosphorylase)
MEEAQIIDTLEEDGFKRYMHFYNFPPYSVGETRPCVAPAGAKSVTVHWRNVPCAP